MTVAATETIAPVPDEAFPIDTLPHSVHQFVSYHARALPVAPDLLALTVLTTLGAAIGNTRRIRVWGDWAEPALIYGAVVADSGGMKTPALNRATVPFRAHNIPSERTWTTDATTERLGMLLSENRRGIYLIKDELTSLVRSLDQYKQGGKGADRQHFLSYWACTPTAVDRVKGASFRVDHPYLSIIGNIPPDCLHELIKASSQGDGFIQRFLFAWPKPVPPYYSGVEVDDSVREKYERLLVRLLTANWPTSPQPVVLSLTPEAKDCFITWHNDHVKRMMSETPLRMQFDSKMKAYCARLALIHAMAENPDAVEVRIESVKAAILQIAYFRAQAHRVAALLSVSVGASVGEQESKEQMVQRAIIRAMSRGSKSHSKRDIYRSMNHCTAEVFNSVWDCMLRPQLTQTGKTLYSLTDTDIPTKAIPCGPFLSTIDIEKPNP